MRFRVFLASRAGRRRLAGTMIALVVLSAACSPSGEAEDYPTDVQSLTRLLPVRRDLGSSWETSPESGVEQLQQHPRCSGPILKSADLFRERTGERLYATASPVCPERDEVEFDEEYLRDLGSLYFRQLQQDEIVRVDALTVQERTLFDLPVRAIDVSASLYIEEVGAQVPFQAVLLTRTHRGVTLIVTLDGYNVLFSEEDVNRIARWMARRW